MKVCIIAELDSEQLAHARSLIKDANVDAEVLVEGENAPSNIGGFIVGVTSSTPPSAEVKSNPNYSGSIGIPGGISEVLGGILNTLKEVSEARRKAAEAERISSPSSPAIVQAPVAQAPVAVAPNHAVVRINITDAMKETVTRETSYSRDQINEFLRGNNITDLGMAIRHRELPSDVKSILERFI